MYQGIKQPGLYWPSWAHTEPFRLPDPVAKMALLLVQIRYRGEHRVFSLNCALQHWLFAGA